MVRIRAIRLSFCWGHSSRIVAFIRSVRRRKLFAAEKSGTPCDLRNRLAGREYPHARPAYSRGIRNFICRGSRGFADSRDDQGAAVKSFKQAACTVCLRGKRTNGVLMTGFAVLCAWCGNRIGSRPPAAGELVSHGICPECFKRFAAEFSDVDAVKRARAIRPLPGSPSESGGSEQHDSRLSE